MAREIIPPMNPPSAALVQSFVDDIQARADELNRRNDNDYKIAFSNWLRRKDQETETTGHTAGSAPEPTDYPLTQVDQNLVANLYLEWSAALYSYSMFRVGMQPILDLSSAISKIVPMRLTVPRQGPASIGPKVGPLVAPGQWATIAGDISPIGTEVTSGSITYVKVGVDSPFGWFGVHWERKL